MRHGGVKRICPYGTYHAKARVLEADLRHPDPRRDGGVINMHSAAAIQAGLIIEAATGR